MAEDTIRYDTIEEFNVDWKAEYSALSSTRSQKKKLKQKETKTETCLRLYTSHFIIQTRYASNHKIK